MTHPAPSNAIPTDALDRQAIAQRHRRITRTAAAAIVAAFAFTAPLSFVWPSLYTVLFLLSAPGSAALTYALLRERRQAAVPSTWLWVAGAPVVANALLQLAFHGPAGLFFLFSG